MKDANNIQQTQKCLSALGSAWRGDWSDFDGRTLRDQLDDIAVNVLTGKKSYEQFCDENDIHPEQMCWK